MTKNIDKDLYVVYDCFNKGSISCSFWEKWLKEFCFFFEKLSPTSKNFPVDADPGLLALAYAVSIAEERHPAANEFEEKEKLVNHLINSKFSRCEVVKREISNYFSRCEVEKRETRS